MDGASSSAVGRDPQTLVQIWKLFRTAAGLREFENFAATIEYAESNLDLRLNDQDPQTLA